MTDFPFQMRGAPSAQRAVVLHYHLFKNAGSSVDEILRQNFPGCWIQHEFHDPPRRRAEALATFVQENPQASAISSHSALLPVPQIENVTVFPILFIRHPIDRLRSAYAFERTQAADTLGARLAKLHNFGGYVRELLKLPNHRQVRNFQTYRLSHNGRWHKRPELVRALRALRKLPFVGLVEEFEKSMRQLESLLQPLFPGFRAELVHKNVTACGTSLAERLTWIRESLGDALYEEIRTANSDDLALHTAVAHRWMKAGAGQPRNLLRTRSSIAKR